MGTDLFVLNNHNYILMVDYYSSFPIIRRLSSTRSSCVIDSIKSVMSEYGIPAILVWRNRGFPTLGHKPFAGPTVYSKTALFSILASHARLTDLGLDRCNFPYPPPHEYSYSPLLAGCFTNFRPIRAKRWHPPPLRMRPSVRIPQFQ